MADIASDIDRLGRIVVKGQAALIFCKPVRQVWGPENSAIFPQMMLVPGQGIIVEGISPVQVLRWIGIQQMIHEQDIIHLSFVEDGQIVDLLFIRKNVFDGFYAFRPLTDLHDHKELGDKAFRKQKAGFVIRINICELIHKGFHIGVFGELACIFQVLSRLIAVGQVGPGQLDQKTVIAVFDIFFPDIIEIFPVGFVVL